MKISILALVAAIAFPAAALQDQPPPMPKPGKEHDILKSFAGEWELKTKFKMDPAQPPSEGKGTESARLAAGGFFLVFDVKGDMGGMNFEGHGVMGYDTFKKKYVGSWVDSMSPAIYTYEGDIDKDGKKLTLWMEGPNPVSGEKMKQKHVIEIQGADSRRMIFYMDDAEGKELELGSIEYQRKK
jgi:hypothetical protein